MTSSSIRLYPSYSLIHSTNQVDLYNYNEKQKLYSRILLFYAFSVHFHRSFWSGRPSGQEERERIRLEELRVKEQQTRQVVQELEQLLAKAEEEATKARQVGNSRTPAQETHGLLMALGRRFGMIDID